MAGDPGSSWSSQDQGDVEFLSDTFSSGMAKNPLESRIGFDAGERDLIKARVYGERSTFGSVSWWNKKDWWKLSTNGEGNDIQAHFGGAKDLAIAAATLRGNRHRLQGSANQDSFAISTVETKEFGTFVVAVVCDGMGSAKYSGFGARMFAYHTMVALRTTVENFPDTFEQVLNETQEGTLRYISNRVVDYRQDEFEAPELPFESISLSELQCTMSFLIIPAEANSRTQGIYRVIAGGIGDSPILVLRDRSWVSLDAIGDVDDVWTSATMGAIGAEHLSITAIEVTRSDAILLATDGVGNFAHFQGCSTQLGTDLAQRWSRPIGLHEFIRDCAFEIQSADDDRTAIMIWFDRDHEDPKQLL